MKHPNTSRIRLCTQFSAAREDETFKKDSAVHQHLKDLRLSSEDGYKEACHVKVKKHL